MRLFTWFKNRSTLVKVLLVLLLIYLFVTIFPYVILYFVLGAVAFVGIVRSRSKSKFKEKYRSVIHEYNVQMLNVDLQGEGIVTEEKMDELKKKLKNIRKKIDDANTIEDLNIIQQDLSNIVILG